MNEIYLNIGVGKQAFHQWLNRTMGIYEEQGYLLPIIRQLRGDHPRMSCRHMYLKLKPKTMGRDRFGVFCHQNGFKVEVKKRGYRTTDSRGTIYFPNLLLTLDELTGINQLWVSDITYFEIDGELFYLTFIMDVYNREIVGFSVSDNLRTESTTLPAPKMAIANRKLGKESGLIFHSDGGGQYYCKVFVSLTNGYGIKNSMGKTAYENPIAERINGTIKNDYNVGYQQKEKSKQKRKSQHINHIV